MLTPMLTFISVIIVSNDNLNRLPDFQFRVIPQMLSLPRRRKRFCGKKIYEAYSALRFMSIKGWQR